MAQRDPPKFTFEDSRRPQNYMFAGLAVEAPRSVKAPPSATGCPKDPNHRPSRLICNNSCETIICGCGQEYHPRGAQSIAGHDPLCGIDTFH
jgi:hypothetical protein